MSHRPIRLVLTTVILAVAAMFITIPASACMITCVCTPYGCGCTGFDNGLVPGGTTLVTMVGQDKALVQIGPYTTPHMTTTFACSVAFPLVPGIRRVDKLTLVADATGQPLSFYHWNHEDAAIAQFENLAEGEANMSRAADMRWQGFFSKIEGGSPGGIMHSFVFEVTLEPGTTLPKLLAGLRAQGVLAHGSANFDGTLDYGHYYLRRVGDGDIHAVFAGDREGTRAPRVNQQP
jgi:hypothetical protein